MSRQVSLWKSLGATPCRRDLLWQAFVLEALKQNVNLRALHNVARPQSRSKLVRAKLQGECGTTCRCELFATVAIHEASRRCILYWCSRWGKLVGQREVMLAKICLARLWIRPASRF